MSDNKIFPLEDNTAPSQTNEDRLFNKISMPKSDFKDYNTAPRLTNEDMLFNKTPRAVLYDMAPSLTNEDRLFNKIYNMAPSRTTNEDRLFNKISMPKSDLKYDRIGGCMTFILLSCGVPVYNGWIDRKTYMAWGKGGTMNYANGDKYEGEWKDDKQHGKGVFTSASGD